LKGAVFSIKTFHTASLILVGRPSISDKAFSHVCGHFNDEFFDWAKESSRSARGWRLHSDSVAQKVKEAKKDALPLFCSVIFCEQFGIKFAWGLLLTDLNDNLCHVLLNDIPFQELPPQLFDIISKKIMITLDLLCCELRVLPNKLKQLTHLKNLLLHSNKLLRLPMTLGYLEGHLETFTLTGNLGFEMPPKEIVEMGQPAAMGYLRKRVKCGPAHKAAQLIWLGIGDGAQHIALATLLIENISFPAVSVSPTGI